MGRTIAAGLLVIASLSATACGPTQAVLDVFRGDGVPQPADPVELFSGDTGAHAWSLVAGNSPDGPVLQSYRDGELQGTSWGWIDSRTLDAPLELSAGVPHADGDDIDSPLLDHLQGFARTDVSVDEVVLYRGEEIVGRWEPIVHPAGDFAVAPLAASGTLTGETFWVVACRDGEPSDTQLAWSPIQGSLSTPALDPCGDA